jgi:hypothetical protein
VEQKDMDLHVLNRVAAAASCLLSDPDLFFDPVWQPILLSHHRWLASLFAATPFRNADHVMRALNLNEGDKKSDLHQLHIGADDLLKFCLLYSPESEVPLDLDALWAADKVLAAGLCLVLLSPRFLGSPAAHAKREQILPWLSQCLDKIDDIEQLPLHTLRLSPTLERPKQFPTPNRPSSFPTVFYEIRKCSSSITPTSSIQLGGLHARCWKTQVLRSTFVVPSSPSASCAASMRHSFNTKSTLQTSVARLMPLRISLSPLMSTQTLAHLLAGQR